ncbi:hypothetical protein SSS_04474 [Sarcoptes scabiei]|nr:hypothetical protein SSS_04474 [Sarcoptes scabiei]
MISLQTNRLISYHSILKRLLRPSLTSSRFIEHQQFNVDENEKDDDDIEKQSKSFHSLPNGPDLNHFIRKQQNLSRKSFIMKWDDIVEEQPYIDRNVLDGNGQKVHIKTYGCQMNLNDTEIASSILEQYNYNLVDEIDQAEIILLMTCAIRENAENKVWDKLRKFSKQKKSGKLKKFGLLGCMAERLKSKVLDSIPNIDIVAGPDSYRFFRNFWQSIPSRVKVPSMFYFRSTRLMMV